MSKPLLPLSIEAPGFLGLNTQNSGSVLPPGWAVDLNNLVYDDIGRLASRKGSVQQYSDAERTSKLGASPVVRQLHEYIDATGSKVTIFAAGNAIYKLVGSTVTDISGTITTPTADNWQFANWRGTCVGYQAGHAPVELLTAAGTFANAAGTMHNGSMVLSAYGRTWTVESNTLYYSDLLIHSYAGGSAGSFDLATYWPNGMDEAVAIADFNGFLVVFGKESIIVYDNPDNPAGAMSIVEGIEGTGCIARDSIQVIGNEIVFLSSTGVRTLGRVIQEKSMPLGDISRHVRDALIEKATSEVTENIRSVYNRDEGFYILSFPLTNTTYVFDLKFPNQDGTWKATTWDYAPTAMVYTQDLNLYIAKDSGFVSLYDRYLDSILSDNTGGSAYFVEYEGVWNDFGEEAAHLLKIPKRAAILAAGYSGGQIAFRWALDYSSIWKETQLTFLVRQQSQYGIGKYGVAKYSGALEFERVTGNMSSAGQVIKIGLRADIQGVKFALQRVDILAKVGRLGI